MDTCLGKTSYGSEGQATQAAKNQARRNGDRRLSAYLCDLCHRWHLTGRSSRSY